MKKEPKNPEKPKNPKNDPKRLKNPVFGPFRDGPKKAQKPSKNVKKGVKNDPKRLKKREKHEKTRFRRGSSPVFRRKTLKNRAGTPPRRPKTLFFGSAEGFQTPKNAVFRRFLTFFGVEPCVLRSIFKKRNIFNSP